MFPLFLISCLFLGAFGILAIIDAVAEARKAKCDEAKKAEKSRRKRPISGETTLQVQREELERLIAGSKERESLRVIARKVIGGSGRSNSLRTRTRNLIVKLGLGEPDSNPRLIRIFG